MIRGIEVAEYGAYQGTHYVRKVDSIWLVLVWLFKVIDRQDPGYYVINFSVVDDVQSNY